MDDFENDRVKQLRSAGLGPVNAPQPTFGEMASQAATDTLQLVREHPEYKAMLDNLTSCQARCTELLLENRELKKSPTAQLDRITELADEINNTVTELCTAAVQPSVRVDAGAKAGFADGEERPWVVLTRMLRTREIQPHEFVQQPDEIYIEAAGWTKEGPDSWTNAKLDRYNCTMGHAVNVQKQRDRNIQQKMKRESY